MEKEATAIVRRLKVLMREWIKNHPETDEIEDPEITELLDFIKTHKKLFAQILPQLQLVFPGLK